MDNEIRYHFRAHFIEEQRKGFAVHHQIEKDCHDVPELAESMTSFMSSYNSEYCYGLTLGVSEEPSLVN